MTPEATEPTPLPWRGTTFTFNQSATTTIFGIGRDNIGGEGESYGWEFALRPFFYLLDLPRDKVVALAEIAWLTELTNSDTTADRNETQFRDTILGVKYTRTLFESGGADKGEYKTTGGVTLRTVLPTSPLSYDTGKYFTLAIGPDIKQQFKLLGSKADGLNNITAGLSLTYSHLFSRSYTPTNSDLHVPRASATGQSIDSDQLSGYSFDIDRLTTTLTLNLPLYKGLELDTSFSLRSKWKHDFEEGAGAGCDVAIANDPCVQAIRLEDRTTYNVDTSFNVGLSYPIYEVAGVTLGYANLLVPQNAPDGKNRSIFYSPDAQFYLDIVANLDVIYTKVTRRDQQPASAALKPRKNEY